MAKLQHIQAAMNGETQVEPIQERISVLAQEGAHRDQELEKFIIFKLVNTSKRGGVYIDGIDDVWNEETNQVERIRLLTGVPSIWLKDQKHVTEDYASKNRRSLHFPRGAKVLRISENDITMLEFARRCNDNAKPKQRRLRGSHFEFFEYNPQQASKEAYDKEVLEMNMSIKASQLPIEEVRKIVSFVKIPIYDEVGELKTEERLKTDLMLYAKKNAVAFEKLIGDSSKEVELAYAIKKLIQSNLIDINTYPGRAFWSSGGATIGVIPNGQEPVKFLTELAMTNTEAGRTFADQLNNKK